MAENYEAEFVVKGNKGKVTLWDIPKRVGNTRIRTLSYPGTSVFLYCFAIDDPSSFADIPDWAKEVFFFCSKVRKKKIGPFSHTFSCLSLILVSLFSHFSSLKTQNKCPTAISFLVGLKSDLREEGQEQQQESEKFITEEEGFEMANKIHAIKYLECSAITRKGLKTIFHFLFLFLFLFLFPSHLWCVLFKNKMTE